MLKNSKVNFRLIFITSRKLSKTPLALVVKSACRAGVKAVQIREKDLHASGLVKIIRDIKKITFRFKASLIINDRLDIALLTKSNGLHIPENGLLPSQIKKFSPGLITGKSVHSLKEARGAEKNGFDYIQFGPIFKTPAKVKFGTPQGLDNLKKVCSAVNIPVFAVGGISTARVKKCLDAGAHGVAVIRSIMKSKNMAGTINEFKNELGKL